MEKILLMCITCGSELKKPSDVKPEQVVALTCANKECARFGLLTVVAERKKAEESRIIKPGDSNA